MSQYIFRTIGEGSLLFLELALQPQQLSLVLLDLHGWLTRAQQPHTDRQVPLTSLGPQHSTNPTGFYLGSQVTGAVTLAAAER